MSETGRRGQALDVERLRKSELWNEDLAPTPPEKRAWGAYEFATLWIGMSICIPSYMLASSLIAGGMSWKQAVFTIFLGNVIVLVPMLLNSHAGARYGVSFPVFARSAFGVLGANIPSVARALVACGWFGIQTWIGGQAIHTILVALWPGWANVRASPTTWYAKFRGVIPCWTWIGRSCEKSLNIAWSCLSRGPNSSRSWFALFVL